MCSTDTEEPKSEEKLLQEAEKTRLENALQHLIRSNAEIREALSLDDDPVYIEALQENEVVIQSMREKLTLIEAALSRMNG